MLRSALLVVSSNFVTSFLLLVRSLLIARLIPVADFGIASTLALAMAVVEMMSALGLQQQLVQARDGEDPRFQAALQGFQLLRGVLGGAILFVLAEPMARFFEIPEAAWGYRVMAAVPVLHALIHFDIYRFNRKMEFGPGLLTNFVSTLASVLAIWPLAAWFGDWRVMLFSLLLQSTLSVAISHWVARRPYRVLLDRKLMTRSFSFGWPILINGLLLFMVFNGDKMIVGRELGMETLAVFAMGTTLTLTPTIVLSKTAASLFLARLSAPLRETEAGEAVFRKRALAAFELYLLMGLLLILGTALLGPWLVDLVLGEKFGILAGLIVAMSITQSLRMMKGGPSLVAMARGITTNPMIANIVRVALLPVAWAFLASGGDLLSLIYVATLGETVGALVAFNLVRRRSGLALRDLSLLLSIVAAFYAAAFTLGHGMAAGGVAAMVPRGLLIAAMAGLVLAALAATPNLRTLLAAQIRRTPG